MTTTDLALRDTGRGNTMAQKVEYARLLAASKLLPVQYRNQPENLLWAMEYAQTLGIEPMAAVTGIHVINGQPSASASLITALVRRAGHKLRVQRIPDGARCTIIRADDPDYEHEVVFTMADARAAGLISNDNWKKRPAVMCEWRAVTACARLACSEVLYGVAYTPDELNEDIPAGTVPPAPQPAAARVTAADILKPTAPATAPEQPAPTPEEPVMDVLEGVIVEDPDEPEGWK